MRPSQSGKPKEISQPGRDEKREIGTRQEKGQEKGNATMMPFLLLSPTQHVPAQNYQQKPHTHVRSRSLATPSSAPVMARAHSSPGLDSRGRYVFPQSPGKPLSPHEIPLRRPSPLRTSFDGPTSTTQGGYGITISEPISEQPELQASPVSYTSGNRINGRSVSPSWSPSIHNTLPRVSRRRPSSPLLANTAAQAQSYSIPSPSRPSPIILPAKFNEPYPIYSFSSGSSISMPSTPSSIRSRSPSISSLETIPDIPDAEAAAIEADQIARLKAAADKADAAADAGGFSSDPKRRSAIDMSSPGSRFGSGWADKRKRWSVCGAEGRQDLDLETIWED
ncbi:uncharacterized protein GIQ15_00397 [Arthroderma uncinatum]|uniref:uncharacterized protein n=1 Tax=Arthroderma uncinatum TaxID=74035 RepID=UPI00144A8EBD|nr:uncharacterized protein GIQ15_00397 [Arthroderma uncinatum]KAF3490880.1 hypothetical protein GIQ15_00397 [Arthroderma uncinatum]